MRQAPLLTLAEMKGAAVAFAAIAALFTLPPWGLLPARLPRAAAQLASDLDRAQEIIDERASTSRQLASAARFEQLATLELHGETSQARRTIQRALGGRAEVSIRSDLEAAAALAALITPRRSLPHWRIVQPPAPNILLGYFRAAQSRFGVPWEYLAAIEFKERLADGRVAAH